MPALTTLLVSGCSGQPLHKPLPQTYEPFDDRPDLQLTFQHKIAVVKGTVRHFNEDGSQATHHFVPVETVTDRNTYVLSVTPAQLDIEAVSDVLALARAAEQYCEDAGLVAVSAGLNLFAAGEETLLVEKCVPQPVILPPWYKSGDRVPR
ncbi:hypothetical protein [Leisingera sp. ANG-M1]|uniref:hypothetical protein n=1 Tax=Leisingera sp. ANG-M1 TaxID=1577895 RepID=UPI00126A28BE|nr:hypothetical protein [Leisingera sp. ANG-M1]